MGEQSWIMYKFNHEKETLFRPQILKNMYYLFNFTFMKMDFFF